MLILTVHDESIEAFEVCMRCLRKKMQNCKTIRILKMKRYYVKPTEQRKRDKEASIKRCHKVAKRKRMED